MTCSPEPVGRQILARVQISDAEGVLELVWLAVVHYHQDAIPGLARRKLKGKYLVLPHILKA